MQHEMGFGASLTECGRRAVRTGLLVALSLVAIGGAQAAIIEAQSRVSAVTLYPDAAIVRRELSIDIPAGSHEVMVQDLPGSLDPASMRVEGAAESRVIIVGVEMRTRSETAEAVKPESQRRLIALRMERDRVTDRIDAVEGRKAMIQRFGQGVEGRDAKPLDIGSWSQAWELVGKGLQAVNEELRGFRDELTRIEAEIAAIERPQAMPRSGVRRAAIIALEAPAAGRVTLSVSYRVAGAAWRPVYDARLSTSGSAPGLDLVRRALIRQNSGEDWTDVALVLSTLQVSRSTAAPELRGQKIAILEPPPPRPVPAPSARLATDAAPQIAAEAAGRATRQKAVGDPEMAMAETSARLDVGAYHAEFAVPGKVTLPAGNAERSVRLGDDRPEITLAMLSAPALDPKAYLEVRFAAPGGAPLLPGEVILTRDGTFIGRGQLPLIAPGDHARLGFGADDRVIVKRVAIGREAREPGFLGSTRTDEQRYRITVKNLHAFPVAMRIEDRIPVSEDQTIVVERMPDMTKPDLEAPDDRRGVFAWAFTLKTGEERAFITAYRLRWPAGKDTRITPLPR